MDDGPGIEKLLVYALPGLQALASGTDAARKADLATLLEDCADTAEKRKLVETLAGGAK